MAEVLLQEIRVAAVQLKLLGRRQRIAVQHVDATAQAALGIARAVDQAEPAGGTQDVQCAGDGLARRLGATGAGCQVGLQVP